MICLDPCFLFIGVGFSFSDANRYNLLKLVFFFCMVIDWLASMVNAFAFKLIGIYSCCLVSICIDTFVFELIFFIVTD